MSNTSQPTTLPARSLQEMLRNMIEMDRRLSDLDTAREAAASATPDLPTFVEQHLHQLWQLSLQRTSLRSRADTITEESLETLTLLGYTDEAIRLAWLRSSADAQAYGLHTIGSYLLLRKPDDPQALELLQHVAALSLQEWGHMLIRTYINAGHLDRARAIADAMISLDTHSWALRNIAIALAEQHQWAEAQAITQTIEDLSDQDDARASLVEALIGQQQWKAARTAAEAFNNPERSYWAHIKHMEGLYKAGNPDQAQPLFESGLREALTQPNSDQRDHLLQMLAQSLTNAEQFDHAEIVVYHIHQFWPQANTRAALILALAQCGKLQAAQRLIGTACVAAEQFDNHWNSMQMLIRLTKQLSEAGITSIIDLLFDAARKAISRLENTNSSVNALCELGKALAHGQRWDAARTILSSFENQIVRDNLREALAISLIKAHQWDAAAATIAEIDELRIGSEMLRILGVALNAAGRHETALHAFTAAYSDIKLIVDRKQQTDALDRLAADVAHAGIRAYAEHILSSAITVAEVIENSNRSGPLAGHGMITAWMSTRR